MALFDEIMGNKPADSSGADSNVVDVEYEVKDVDGSGNQ